MAAEFSLPLTAEGAVTEPTGVFPFSEPSAESETYLDAGSAQVLVIPEFNGKSAGWAIADGVNPLRFVTDGSVLDAGGVAPSTAPTLGVTGGGHAAVVGTWTGQPLNGEQVKISNGVVGFDVTFKTALVTDGTGDNHQVLIGATANDTYENLQALIQLSGTQGTEYWSMFVYFGYGHTYYGVFGVEVSAINTGAGTITFRAYDSGSLGNSIGSTETATNFSFASATFTGGGDGTGTEPGSGTYRIFYTWFREADGAETGRSPIATITQRTNTNIAVSALAASADTSFDFIRIYRTTKEGVEFRLTGSVARSATTYTDAVSDEDLARSQLWEPLNHRQYAEGMPPRGRALALWKGSLWTIGARLHATYTRGTVAVVQDSATITFSTLGITKLMVGRTFQADATSEEYTILSINESAGTAVVDREYEGSDDATATFAIRDAYDANRLMASVQFQYNLWPVEQSPGRVDTDDTAGGMALLATNSRLFAFTRTSITSLTGEDAESWVLHKMTDGVGAEAPSMVTAVGGGGVFLSRDGFYALSPDESMVSISSPKTQPGVTERGIDGTISRINWASIEQGYSLYDPIDRLVIFGLPLDGAQTPNYEIIFDTQNGTWALYKRAEWTALSAITLPGGGPAILAGDRDGTVWHVGIGESDGFYGTEAVQTLTGTPTVRVLTVTGTPFSTSGDGEAGKPFLILYADGETVAYGKVASNTTSALTLCEDLDTAPVAGDQIVMGGIAWQAKSGHATFGEEYRAKTLRSVTIRHAPSTRGDYFLSFATDGGDFQLCPVGSSVGDLTEGDGKVQHTIQWPGDSHAINIRGFKPGGRAILRGGVFDLVLRENGRM